MNVLGKFGDSAALNTGRIIRICQPHLFYGIFLFSHVAFCSRPEAASDVLSERFVGPIVHDRLIKVGGTCTNRSREIAPKGGIFKVF